MEAIFAVSRGVLGEQGVIFGSSTTNSFNYFEFTYFLTTPATVMFIGNGTSRDSPDFSWTVPNDVSMHSLACSRNGTAANGIIGYDNGVLINQATRTKISTSPGFYIGKRAGSGFILNGYISEII